MKPTTGIIDTTNDNASAPTATTGEPTKGRVCRGVPGWSDGLDSWCHENCNHTPSYCPRTHCTCMPWNSQYSSHLHTYTSFTQTPFTSPQSTSRKHNYETNKWNFWHQLHWQSSNCIDYQHRRTHPYTTANVFIIRSFFQNTFERRPGKFKKLKRLSDMLMVCFVIQIFPVFSREEFWQKDLMIKTFSSVWGCFEVRPNSIGGILKLWTFLGHFVDNFHEFSRDVFDPP